MGDGFKKYSWLWSSTQDLSASKKNQVKMFSFHRGRSYDFDKKTDSLYVRCVRGQVSSHQSSANTYRDGKLMWQNQQYTSSDKSNYDSKRDSGKVGKWDRAKVYCSSLEVDGFRDW